MQSAQGDTFCPSTIEKKSGSLERHTSSYKLIMYDSYSVQTFLVRFSRYILVRQLPWTFHGMCATIICFPRSDFVNNNR